MILKLLGIGAEYMQAKAQRKAAIQAAKAQAEVMRINNGHTWENTVVQVSTRFLRWTLALHVLVAMDATIYLAIKDHEQPAIIFTALAACPEWFIGLLATMFGFAFGSEPIKNVGAKLFEMYMKRSIR